jgi:hypothetical protein
MCLLLWVEEEKRQRLSESESESTCVFDAGRQYEREGRGGEKGKERLSSSMLFEGGHIRIHTQLQSVRQQQHRSVTQREGRCRRQKLVLWTRVTSRYNDE